MLKDHPRIRLALYLAGIACAVTAPFVVVGSPEYGAAFVTAGAVLEATALGVAASNRTKPTD